MDQFTRRYLGKLADDERLPEDVRLELRLQSAKRRGPAARFKPTLRATGKRHQREDHNDATSEVREAVWMRSRSRCEACGAFLGDGERCGVLDHFFGGSGRRGPETTVEGCWRLCDRCDKRKTDNRPTYVAWLELYLGHCRDHRFTAQAERVQAQLELERVQHPPDRRTNG
jgi:hypothetical protein